MTYQLKEEGWLNRLGTARRGTLGCEIKGFVFNASCLVTGNGSLAVQNVLWHLGSGAKEEEKGYSPVRDRRQSATSASQGKRSLGKTDAFFVIALREGMRKESESIVFQLVFVASVSSSRESVELAAKGKGTACVSCAA